MESGFIGRFAEFATWAMNRQFNRHKRSTDFARQVAAKAARKLRAQREGSQGVWFGLGMSGLIGWSVAVPTLVGAMLGLWWDRHHPGAIPGRSCCWPLAW